MGGLDGGVKLDGLVHAHQGLIKPEDAFMENKTDLAQTRMLNPRAKALLFRAWRMESCFADSKRKINMLELKIDRALARIDAVIMTDRSRAYGKKKKLYAAVYRHVTEGIDEIEKYRKLSARMKIIYRRARRAKYCVARGTQHFDPELTQENVTEFLSLASTYSWPDNFTSFSKATNRVNKSTVAFYTEYLETLQVDAEVRRARAEKVCTLLFNMNNVE